jgi:hypothetical protein
MAERPVRKYNSYNDPRLMGELHRAIGDGYKRIEPGSELERLYLTYRTLRGESEVPQGQSRTIKELGPEVEEKTNRLIREICKYAGGPNQEINGKILENRRDSLRVAFIDTLPAAHQKPGIILPVLPVPWRKKQPTVGALNPMNGLIQVAPNPITDEVFTLMHEESHGLMGSGSLKQHLTQGIVSSGYGLYDKVTTKGEKIPKGLGRKLHVLNEALADFCAFTACQEDIDMLSYFEGRKGMDPNGLRAILGIGMNDDEPDTWPSLIQAAFFTGIEDKAQAETFVTAFEKALPSRK